MKIYISGKITGLPLQEVKERFASAQALLEEIGFETVNPLEKGLPESATWKQHMVKDIELLLQCDAIYLMENWVDSLGAKIEHDIAKRMDLYFLHESMIDEKRKEYEEAKKKENERINSIVMQIDNAIYEVTGMKFNEYITQSRKRDGVFARMIFVYHCRKQYKMKLTKIAKYVHRDHSSLLHLLKKYNDDFKYNPQFRDLAIRVNNILNKTTK